MCKASNYLRQVQDIKFEAEKDIIKMLIENPELQKRHMIVRGKAILIGMANNKGRKQLVIDSENKLIPTTKVSAETVLDILESMENNNYVY